MKSAFSLLVLFCFLQVRAGDPEQEHNKTENSACPIRLKPNGQCGDNEECPYQVTLPPLTLQLPKQFKMLERVMKDLQNLKEDLSNLKRSCLECKQQADESQPRNADEAPTAEDETGNDLKEIQSKLKKMSISLKNTKNQINILQSSSQEMNEKKVEEIVNNVLQNKLENCPHDCPFMSALKDIRVFYTDCSDRYSNQEVKNGIYLVTPDRHNSSFNASCDMESFGGGWTVIQRRVNGDVSFNRTWKEYKDGFGDLRGDFWLGNDKIHLLTKAKDMVLRIEMEDLDGVREYAKYAQFYVSNEYLKYRLSVSSYSGTAGDSLHFSKHYNHDQKFFSTPDKDNDMYPSGNCGSYYSSGWWFDACMASNLNGIYYNKKYKGVRNGIFWGTWHNISDGQPNGYKQAFKSVIMMIRPKNFNP
ncbi:fibroleukin [Erpetoichthys calabaricus]|uniref:fibroleukin n=1 Tax=Erpetoichthys calabaricus TaxID=27687 RepID=UPI002234B42B|nr:fibroleukin [Erpetoichthys calabaricus]